MALDVKLTSTKQEMALSWRYANMQTIGRNIKCLQDSEKEKAYFQALLLDEKISIKKLDIPVICH